MGSEEIEQLVSVVMFALDGTQRADPIVEWPLEVGGIESSIFPIYDCVDLQRVWINDDVVLGQIAVAEDVVVTIRGL